MIAFRRPQRRLISALLALWLALCAVAACVALPDKVIGGSAVAMLSSPSDIGGSDHCTPDDGEHRCDDRRQGEHRGLADLLPLFALFVLPFILLSQRISIQHLRPHELPHRLNRRLHLLHCVQLN